MSVGPRVARSRLLITETERGFPVRVRIAVPDSGFVARLDRMHLWLDRPASQTVGFMTRARLPGVVNEAVAVYSPTPCSPLQSRDHQIGRVRRSVAAACGSPLHVDADGRLVVVADYMR